MIKAWIADVSPLYLEEKYKKIYDTLPYFRKLKADGIKSAKKKAQSAGVWFLLRTVKEKYNISDKAVFNLSHTGDYVICAVDLSENEDTLVGVDGETIHKVPLKLAKRFYCESEYKHILAVNEADQEKEIIRVWVLKESFMKATRKGMALGADTFEFDLESEAKLVKKPEEYKEKFYFKEYALDKAGCMIAVCSTDSEICDSIDMSFFHLY